MTRPLFWSHDPNNVATLLLYRIGHYNNITNNVPTNRVRHYIHALRVLSKHNTNNMNWKLNLAKQLMHLNKNQISAYANWIHTFRSKNLNHNNVIALTRAAPGLANRQNVNKFVNNYMRHKNNSNSRNKAANKALNNSHARVLTRKYPNLSRQNAIAIVRTAQNLRSTKGKALQHKNVNAYVNTYRLLRKMGVSEKNAARRALEMPTALKVIQRYRAPGIQKFLQRYYNPNGGKGFKNLQRRVGHKYGTRSSS